MTNVSAIMAIISVLFDIIKCIIPFYWKSFNKRRTIIDSFYYIIRYFSSFIKIIFCCSFIEKKIYVIKYNANGYIT